MSRAVKRVAHPRRRKAASRAMAAKPMEQSKLTLRFLDTIPSTFDALEDVVERLMALARDMGCSGGEMDHVELALREALANAIVHGNKHDPDKNVVVRCFCQHNRGMLLVVEDEGPGFDPNRIPDPTQAECLLETHGRGLFLMKRLMDHVRISRSGRRVTLLKRLAHP